MLVSLTELLKTKSKSQVKKLLKTFKCNLNKDIESFLLHKAILFEKKLRVKTYLIIENNNLIAYFSIGLTSLNNENISNEIIEFLIGERKQPLSIPCFLIGQLGKSDLILDKKIGDFLLEEAIKKILISNEILGGRFILLDAINHTKILRFYCKNGFFPIEKITKQKESIKMFYPLFDE